MFHSAPLWSWNTTSGTPFVTGYPTSKGVQPTKTGLSIADLQNYAGAPIQQYGNPPILIPPEIQLQWIRYAEDNVEQESGTLLCQTYVASPPARQPGSAASIGLTLNAGSSGIQQLGLDYDLADAAYDFFFPRAQDEGWMYQTLRYRPVRSLNYDLTDYNAIKNIAYIYPLLNDFFLVPPQWIITDEDFGYIRLVPAANVQMLPLFAMQLAFMGFAESVPGGLWYQYTAGFTPNDYNSRFSFVKELVLAEASIIALASMQGYINLGALSYKMNMDGIVYETTYDKNGPYAGLIRQKEKRRDELMARLKSKVVGPVIGVL